MTFKHPIPLIFLLEEANFGGTQRQTLEIALRIDKGLFSPEIWTVAGGEELLFMLKGHDIPVKILRKDPKLRPFLAAFALWRQWRKSPPMVIHLGTVFPNIWGRIFGYIFKTPVIVGGCKGQGTVRKQYERYLWRLVHAHICDAHSIKTALEDLGVPKNQVHHINNGVNVDFFTPPKHINTEPEILCVGRMVAEKDHTTLLKAFAKVQKQVPKARLHLVGDGYLLNKMQELSHNLGLQEHVAFHGSSGNVLEHMQAARLFVLSSTSEGTPNALLEAMACGLPIVATAIAGIPDMIENEKQGLLVPPSNADTLASAILRVLQDDTLANNLGMEARKRACSAYSLNDTARKYGDVYMNLLSKALT